MDLILVRHGQSQANKEGILQGFSNYELSDLGKKQAQDLSQYFLTQRFNFIYCSDLTRAVQTAIPTALSIGKEIKKDPSFKEADFGKWENLTRDQVLEKYSDDFNKWKKNYLDRPHYVESYESHLDRFKSGVEKILNKRPEDSINLVFTHGGSIKTQVGYFNKLSGEELTSLRIKNCSLTKIHFSNNTYESGRLIYYNQEVI